MNIVKSKIKDRLLLLLAGLVCSVLAWLFWHTTQEFGFQILSFIVIGSTLADNMRLRRKLKRIKKTNQSVPT